MGVICFDDYEIELDAGGLRQLGGPQHYGSAMRFGSIAKLFGPSIPPSSFTQTAIFCGIGKD
jgi:hypothetical protein